MDRAQFPILDKADSFPGPPRPPSINTHKVVQLRVQSHIKLAKENPKTTYVHEVMYYHLCPHSRKAKQRIFTQ